MLGNWSFGDYFKREAIHYAWDFLTRDLGIPRDRLAVTTYKDDEVARTVWRDEIGIPPERMAAWGDVDHGDDHNFWRMAETGPCGPCSEVHFDRGAHLSEGPECVPDHSEQCPRWLEIWNLVFMEFDQRPDGRVPLPFTSVDTGMGLERMAAALQQVISNYDTDLFVPIHARMRELLGHDPDAFEAERFSYQVIADHSRAVTFLIADGVLPSNEGRGYVLRRILRRAVRHGRLLGRREPFMAGMADVVNEVMGEAFRTWSSDARGSSARSGGRRRSSGGPSTPAPSSSRARSPGWTPGSGSSGAGPRRCRPTRQPSPATSHSSSTTRSGSRSTSRSSSPPSTASGWTARGSTRPSTNSGSGHVRGRRPSWPGTRSSRPCTARSRRARATRRSSATTPRPPRAGSSASCATAPPTTS